MRTFLLAALLLSTPAAAQTVIDGTGADWDEHERLIPALVVRNFRDPLSTQFRYLRRGIQQANRKFWCGEVNAKNSYGAYTGFKAFYFDITNGVPDSDVSDGTRSREITIRGIQRANGC